MKEELYKKFEDSCAYGNIEEVKKYIEMGVNINASRNNSEINALKASLSQGNFDIAEFLLQNGINPDLVLLQSYISVEVEDLMFEIEAGRLSNSDEPNSQYTELLIKYGININSIDFRGKTPLNTAIEDKHPKAEKLLRSLGAKTSEKLKLESKENKD